MPALLDLHLYLTPQALLDNVISSFTYQLKHYLLLH